jgi:hypothetical protein
MQPIGAGGQVAQQQANSAQAEQAKKNQTAMGQAFFSILNKVIQAANENANNQ